LVIHELQPIRALQQQGRTERRTSGKYRNPSISIKELREMTDTVNEYQRFTNFENYIKKTFKEINAHTSFNVTYDKIKKGRSIDLLSFILRKTSC
jgi:plasmid replication initiation protein